MGCPPLSHLSPDFIYHLKLDKILGGDRAGGGPGADGQVVPRGAAALFEDGLPIDILPVTGWFGKGAVDDGVVYGERYSIPPLLMALPGLTLLL